MQPPIADRGLVCPLHKQDMSKVCHKCPLWVHMRGKNPTTDETFDRWGCSLAWLPVLLVENAQMSRQTGAAIESFRNEMMKLNRQPECTFYHEAGSNGEGFAVCTVHGRSCPTLNPKRHISHGS